MIDKFNPYAWDKVKLPMWKCNSVHLIVIVANV